MHKSTPRDVFMYLLAVATLYWSSFNFVRLVFEHVNAAFPDPLNYYYDPASAMRWAIASLIIIFPVYLWVTRFLRKDIEKNPDRGEIKIRKWLIYLTLFLAGLLIIGDLVALVLNFLNGDLTIPFLLKVVTVLAIGAAIFRYYFLDLNADRKSMSQGKLFAWGAIGAVAIAVIGGFFVTGSPFTQRLVRFDSQKTQDLANIESSVVNYWREKNRLPQNLDELRDSILGFVPPRDPQTGEPYTYEVKGALIFKLCANFNLASREDGISRTPKPFEPERELEKWSHPEGAYCFERTIDPELHGKDLFAPIQ
ncbi:MAG: DUF5671 domain-containing protein [Patescibacteria group bacterium]